MLLIQDVVCETRTVLGLVRGLGSGLEDRIFQCDPFLMHYWLLTFTIDCLCKLRGSRKILISIPHPPCTLILQSKYQKGLLCQVHFSTVSIMLGECSWNPWPRLQRVTVFQNAYDFGGSSGLSAHSLQRCLQQWGKCSKMVKSSSTQATFFGRKGMPLKLYRSDRSWSESSALKVSMAVWCLPCFGGWGLKVVFHCAWTFWADFWPVQSSVNGAAGETKNGFCRLPGKDSFLGRSIPGSLAVCPFLYCAIFCSPCSQIYIVRYWSPHSRTFGVCLLLNIVINDPFTWCDASCLLSATVSWASLGRRR